MRILSRFNRNIISWMSMFFFGVIWGSTIPLSKIVTSTGYPPLGLVAWQLVVMIFSLGLILIIKKWRPILNKQKLVFYTIIATLGTLIPNTMSYIAVSELPGGVMAILIATVPMFTLLIALSLKIEAFSSRRMLGVLIGFCAIAIIYLPQASLPDPTKAIFILAGLIAAFFYAAEANYIACKTPPNTEPISTLFMASCIGFIVLVPITLMSGQWITPSTTLGTPEYALILSSVLHAFTYVGYIWLVGFGGPVFSVQIAYPVTLSGVFTSMILLHEKYSLWIWLSLLLIILALFLVQPSTGQVEEKEANQP